LTDLIMDLALSASAALPVISGGQRWMAVPSHFSPRQSTLRRTTAKSK